VKEGSELVFSSSDTEEVDEMEVVFDPRRLIPPLLSLAMSNMGDEGLELS
jgi:hypothetical protein